MIFTYQIGDDRKLTVPWLGNDDDIEFDQYDEKMFDSKIHEKNAKKRLIFTKSDEKLVDIVVGRLLKYRQQYVNQNVDMDDKPLDTEKVSDYCEIDADYLKDVKLENQVFSMLAECVLINHHNQIERPNYWRSNLKDNLLKQRYRILAFSLMIHLISSFTTDLII